jgi:hypothetical protein
LRHVAEAVGELLDDASVVMAISHVRRPSSVIAHEVEVHWWVAINAARAAIDAAEVDRDLSGAQASRKRHALLSELRWLENLSAVEPPSRSALR